MPAVRTPANTNGGRAARSSESAYQRANAPATKIKGVNHAAKTAKLRDRAIIHAFKRHPMKDSTNAAIGPRVSTSDAASNEFVTTNAPASLRPLARKGSRSHDVACPSKARFKAKAKLSKIT